MGRYEIRNITKCSSENCPMRDRCYRAQAPDSVWQSWCNFEYTCNEESGFDEFVIWLGKSDNGSEPFLHNNKQGGNKW